MHAVPAMPGIWNTQSGVSFLASIGETYMRQGINGKANKKAMEGHSKQKFCV